LNKHESQFCISINNLTKNYDNHPNVLNGISLNVGYGKIFGFLGPNGAGKTTIIRILTTLMKPTSGTIRIFGKDILKNPVEIKKRVGVVLQEPSFEARVTVERSLDLYGMYWMVPSKLRKQRIAELLKIFDLENVRKQKTEELSVGYKRRLQVAREFIHEIDLLFLDEPTVGLDPESRRSLLEYIKKQTSGGLTVFFTTHIMEEAEYLCDDIAIITNGKIIAFDTPQGLKDTYGRVKNIRISLEQDISDSILEGIRPIVNASNNLKIINSNTLQIKTMNTSDTITRIIGLLSSNGTQIENVAINSPSLEEVFLDIVKKERQ
jgi:ABC-2 type transport system ATP-binding protein